MINLSELAASIEVGVVEVGNRPVQVRALTAAQHTAVLAAIPKPQPPLGKDPNKGSAAPKIPNENDPAYLSELEAWYTKFRAAVVAVSCRMDVDGGDWIEQMNTAHIELMADKVVKALSLPMIERLYRAQQNIARGLPAEPAGETAADPSSPG